MKSGTDVQTDMSFAAEGNRFGLVFSGIYTGAVQC